MKTTKNQRKYYRGACIKKLAKHLGLFPETVHRIAVFKFLRHCRRINSNVYYYVQSTSDLSTTEMEEYLSKFRAWASEEFNCFIELPGENNGLEN